MDDKKSAIFKNLEEKSKEIDRITKKIKQLKSVLGKVRDTPPPPDHLPPIKRQPLKKDVQQGKRGGLYYLNASNKKNYLTPAQCRKCVTGNFGDSGCPPPLPKKCPLTKAQLRAKNKKLKKQIKQLKSHYTTHRQRTERHDLQSIERDARARRRSRERRY